MKTILNLSLIWSNTINHSIFLKLSQYNEWSVHFSIFFTLLNMCSAFHCNWKASMRVQLECSDYLLWFVIAWYVNEITLTDIPYWYMILWYIIWIPLFASVILSIIYDHLSTWWVKWLDWVKLVCTCQFILKVVYTCTLFWSN